MRIPQETNAVKGYFKLFTLFTLCTLCVLCVTQNAKKLKRTLRRLRMTSNRWGSTTATSYNMRYVNYSICRKSIGRNTFHANRQNWHGFSVGNPHKER